jgi:hypothetical protein
MYENSHTIVIKYNEFVNHQKGFISTIPYFLKDTRYVSAYQF